MQRPAWLTDFSRQGKLPALGLVDEAGCPYIHETLIIADYVDEKYNDRRPLFPVNATAKAIDRIWIDRFTSVILAFYRFVLLGPDGKPGAGSEVDLNNGLADFEAELKRRGTRFFGGTALPGMLDYMIWPWIEFLPALQLCSGDEKYELPAERLPLLMQYMKDMLRDEAVQKSYIPPESQYTFLSGLKVGKPNYDV